MSEKAKKVVRIPESQLIDLINDIVKEAVEISKENIIKEHTEKKQDKTAKLEERIANLEKKLNKK